MDTEYISKKRIEELFSGDSDNVRVAMTYEHKGKVKVLVSALNESDAAILGASALAW